MCAERVTDQEAPSAHILLVEDDLTISDLLAYYLRRVGYEVRQEYDGRKALKAALTAPYDLVLMDLMLPGLDGMTVTREILRRRPGTPLIILSALGERERLLEGFALGVDDYVTKPFDVDVLLARISASLRRAQVASGGKARDLSGDVERDAYRLRLDPDARLVQTDRSEASLTPKEYGLMELLLSQPGHLFSKEELTESVWHQRYIPTSRTLDIHVRRLREKLRRVDGRVEIQGVRGVGYRLALRIDS